MRSVSVSLLVCYEGIKRDLNRRPIYEYRCDERLKTKSEGSINLVSDVDTTILYEELHVVGLSETARTAIRL